MKKVKCSVIILKFFLSLNPFVYNLKNKSVDLITIDKKIILYQCELHRIVRQTLLNN